MNDQRTLIRVPALAAALVVALLLLAGVYTVLASAPPSVEANPALSTAASAAPPAGPDLAPPVEPAPAWPGDSSSTTAWSSGWVTITADTCQVFTHSLGTDPLSYSVDLLFWDADGNWGLNRRNYGGLEVDDAGVSQWYGAYWQRLTADTIQVCRMANDNAADRVLVRVWIPTISPDFYDSGWRNITQTQTIQFNHGLGITSTDLTVGLWFYNPVRGIHHFAYGGLSLDAPPELHGAYWHHLTANSVQVTRQRDDTNVQQVRVVVTRSDQPPAYDSLVDVGDWQLVGQGSAVTFTHGLGESPATLIVRSECLSPTALGGIGIHQMFAGGDHSVFSYFPGWQGAQMQNLTANTVQIVRRQDDLVCPFVRVRVWTPEERAIYLPLVLNNYGGAPEVELAYDDGSAESNQSQATLGSGFAVRFTPPGASARLVRARYYLDTAAAGHPIEVHVWDTAHNDLIAPFEATPPGAAGMGWLDVDLSGYNLTVTGDFYVGFLYSAQHSDPSIGIDTTSPDGRSWEVPWEAYANDYMIRAVVVPQ